MTSMLGIASVTAVLKHQLDVRLADQLNDSGIGNIKVTVLPPDQAFKTNQKDENRLNLFLHRVSPNAAWRNAQQPSHNRSGERIANPPLALNLHYLLAASGSEEFFAEILLGSAMQFFHEQPVLSKKAINDALAAVQTPAPLATSELAEQVEQIKITLENLSNEEISRIWSSTMTHYRSTVSYQVSVLLIQSKHSTKSSLPVKTRSLTVLQLLNPTIKAVENAVGGDKPIVASSEVVIHGTGLQGDITEVWISGQNLSANIIELNDNQIKLQLPPALPAVLYAGVKTVRVIHQVDVSQPNQVAQHRSIFESNIETFILRPSITAVSGPNNDALSVQLNPAVHKSQRVVLLLNQIQTTGVPNAYSFEAPTGNGIVAPATETDTVTFKLKALPGIYLVRVQVDGAESILSMTNDVYDQPQVTIT